MKPFLILTTVILVMAMILVAGCTTAPVQSPKAQGDALFSQGEKEFASGNLQKAADLFMQAREQYSAAGDQVSYIKARDRAFLTMGAGSNFPYNRSEIEVEMALAFPDVSPAQRSAWLDAPMTAILESDGEVWYFSDTIHNVKNHNPSLLRKENARAGHTPLYDSLMPLITTPWKNDSGTYGAPVTYTGSTVLEIPRDLLPANGTLKIWVPVPVESGSQNDVMILSADPALYVKSTTGTGADIGLVYFEIPLEEVTGPALNVTARYRFIQHEQRFVIDPAQVLPYNTSSPLYQQYTIPSKNVAITPTMKAKALAIVGNETNPYLQAQKIYWNIITTHPYSHAPHFWLDATGTPESLYVLETGIGDCASQSLYFAALCRSIGIPARATGGYQMIEGSAGTHIWAEFYLEGYGWIPVDVTAAEGGGASYNATPEDQLRFKTYYFGNLDPYRFIIQKSLDLPVQPGAGDAVIPPFGWVQNPKIVCDTCPENPMILSFMYSQVTITKE